MISDCSVLPRNNKTFGSWSQAPVHAIDATPARRRGSEVHPTHWMIYPQALPRSVTGAKDPTAPTQSEGGIDRYQLSNAPEVAVTLERHSLSPYRLTLTDGL